MSEPHSPVEGTTYLNVDGSKNWIYNGEKWVEMSAPTKNTFGYRCINNQGSNVYPWQVVYDGEMISGTATSVRQAYRDAKKSVKRYRKMEKFLNKGLVEQPVSSNNSVLNPSPISDEFIMAPNGQPLYNLPDSMSGESHSH